MDGAQRSVQATFEPVRVANRDGRSPFVLICDHASNHIPAGYGTLGLTDADLSRHIAWDPGALPVAREMARLLDAPLVASTISRLIVDCNRSLDAPDLIGAVSETTAVPANAQIDPGERARRIALAWTPFHAALDAVVSERLAQGVETRLVSVHSFTPVYKGVARPWPVGILHDDDERLSRPLIGSLRRVDGMVVGDNEPYSPADGVYHTLDLHGRRRGLACAMIEIRNDEISGEAGQRKWAELLAGILSRLDPKAGDPPAPARGAGHAFQHC